MVTLNAVTTTITAMMITTIEIILFDCSGLFDGSIDIEFEFWTVNETSPKF
jgi:hypothetical protein